MDGLNTGQVYTGSGKIWVECISGSDKIRVGCIRIRKKHGSGIFRFYGFRINPTGLVRLFLGYFVFCRNKKLDIFIT